MQFIKTFLYLLTLYSTFRRCYANQHTDAKTLTSFQSSSILLQVTGNVYPHGYYYVTLNLGDPPKPYFLDIETGSHLTWIQCDAPCQKCLPAPHPPYKCVTNELVKCSDPLCEPVHWPQIHCASPDEQCDYNVKYVDGGSSLGVLIRDPFPLQYTNGTIIKPRLAFGCGYHQSHPQPEHRPNVDGILGLGFSKESIVSQLHELGAVRNVVGHCLSRQGDGFLFLGDEFIPSSIVWTPVVHTTEFTKRYFLGLAELYVGGIKTGIKDLRIIFDSASTYTYFVPQAYKTLVTVLMNNLEGKEMYNANDETLPVCWEGSEPFHSIEDVKNIFKPIILNFENSQDTWLELDPEAYLIINEHGHACLGILNSEEVGLPTINLIGDISFLDKIIVYDNENQRIGWSPANCKDLPKSQVLVIP